MKTLLQGLAFCLSLLLLTATAAGQTTYTSTGTATWSAMTWSPAGTPGATDTVVVADGHTVTIDQAVSVASLTVGQGTSGVLTFDGVAARAVTVSDNITVEAGGTFITQAAGAFTNTLSIGGDLTNDGTFDMSQGGTTLLCTVTFTKAGDQAVSGTAPTLTRFRGVILTKSSAANRVLCDISVSVAGTGALTFTAGTWEQTANTLSVTSASQTIAAGGGLVLSGSGSLNMAIAGSITQNGSLTVNTAGTVSMGSGNNSFVTNAGSTTTFTAGSITILGRLTLTDGTVTINGAAISIDPQATNNLSGTSNCFELGTNVNFTFSSGSVTIVDPNSTVGGSGRELRFRAGTGTKVFSGGTIYLGDGVSTTSGAGFRASFDAGVPPISNLTIQTGGTAGRDASLSSNISVGGAFTLASGTLAIADKNLTANGDVTNGTTITSTTGKLILTGGSSAHTVAGAGTYGNVELNDAFGATLTGSPSVTGTLTLTSGNVTTGGNTLAISATGSVARTSGHIVGNLKKNVATGAGVARTFEIGTGSDYAPVDVTFANVSSASDLTASTTGSEHPNLGASGIEPSQSVNRYWSFTNGGVVFDTYDATFTFVPSDVDGGASAGSFIVERYDGSWSGLAEGTRNPTTTQVTGATSFSDFAIGEPLAPEFQLSASSLAFGTVVVFTSKEDSVFLRNVGTADLHVDSITTDNALFVASTTQDSVLPGDSIKVAVTFSPTSIGGQNGNIQFYHDGATSPDTLLVSGTGIAAPPIYSNGTGGGDWNAGSTWIGGVVPIGTDVVIVQVGDSVWLTAAGTCTDLTLQAGARLALNAASLTIPGSSWSFDAASTVYYNNTTTVQSAPAYGNLTYGASGSGNCNGSLTVNGDLTITTATLRGNAGTSGSFTHTVAGDVIVGPGTSARISAVNNGSATTASCTWNIAGNVLLTGNSTNNRLIFYESAGPHSGSAAFSIGGNLEMGTGSQVMFKSSSSTSASYPGGTLDLAGNLVQNGAIGVNSAPSGTSPGLTINLNGTTPQTWSGTGAFAVSAFTVTVNVNNAAGVTLGAPRTINSNVVLALVNGTLTTTTPNLLSVTTGTLSGGSSSSYVSGPLARNVSTGSPDVSFPIGDPSAYAPVAVHLDTVTVGGTLTGSTAAGEHAQIATSDIYAPLSLNRTYTFTNAGTAFVSYDAVFTFVPGDVDAGAHPLLFIGQKYDGSWSDLTEGTRTATSIEITDATGFSDFAFGQDAPLIILSNGTGGGDWSTGSTWQGGNTPGSGDSAVILSSDSVFVTAPAGCLGVLVQSGGKLGLSAKLSVTNLLLNGKAVLFGDTLNPSGAMIVGGTGMYEHARNGGRLPRATWDDGATLKVTGATSATNVGGAPGQSYYHIVWDCPSQTANANMGMHPAADGDTTTTVRGDVTILSSGVARVYFCGPPAGSGPTSRTVARINFNGNLTVSGTSAFSPHGTSANYTDIIVTHLGNVNVTGGNFSISRGSQSGTGTTRWYMRSGNFSMSNATTQNSNAAGARFVFDKTGTQTLTLGAGNTLTALPIEVAGGTSFDMGLSQLRGSGDFILNAGATLLTANAGGLDSGVSVTGASTLSAGANYTFNGSVTQVSGRSLPVTLNDLTMNNAAGMTLDTSTTVNGTFTLTSGNVTTGSHTLAIGPTGSVSRTSGHVVGRLQKNVATGSGVARSFEIGDATNYTPVDVTFASVGTAGDLLATTTAGEHPQIGTAAIDPTKSVNRWYSLENSGIVFTSYGAVFHFVASDVDGGAVPANFDVEKYSGGNWFDLTEGAKTATSTEITGVASFSDFAIGELIPVTHTVTATAGPNGAIDPSGAVIVSHGVGQTFTFTPSLGYHVDSIYVDDAYAGDSSHYDFINVTTDHTIHVTFAANMYTLTVNVVGTGSVTRNPDQVSYTHGTPVQLTANAPLAWLFSGWSGDTTDTANPLTVVLAANTTITATFVEDSVYLAAYRTFNPDSIALDKDNKGKTGKFVKRKPDKVEVKLRFKAPNAASGFTLKMGMLFTGKVHADTTSLVVIDSLMNVRDKTVITAVDSGHVYQVEGFGAKGKQIKVQVVWMTLPRVTRVSYKDPLGYVVNQPRLPMPNRVNALFETFEQGGFAATLGLKVGRDRSLDSAKQYGWLLSGKYTEVIKTLSDKTGLHTGGTPQALITGANGRAMLKRFKSIPPAKQKNPLLAHLVALKFNIAASALGKTPVGFGELIYQDSSATGCDSAYNGLSIAQIAALGDTAIMGYWSGGLHRFDSCKVFGLAAVAKKLNDAFEGPMDTVDFATKLHTTGTRPLSAVSYLRADPNAVPTIIIPTKETIAEVPAEYMLYQNYPNPFNPTTTIEFDLPEQAFVTLKVYNVVGQEVATLVNNEFMDDGTQEFEFTAADFSSGVYFYRLVAQGVDEDGVSTSSFTTVKKMILVK